MSPPLVSVLMAVHNNGPYLEEAIASVLAQTLTEIELLVVDDGSGDGSWEIISAAARRDSRVVARRRPTNGGASKALNDALALARGRFITRQDGDDVSLPTRVLEQVQFLESTPDAAGVGTQAVLVDQAGGRLTETSFPVDPAVIDRTLIESMCFVGPTVMARRSIWQRAGLWFDEELSGSEDYDLCLRLAEHGPLANLPRALYLYRQHAESVSHRRRHLQLARKAQALDNAVRRRHQGHPPADALVDVARDFLRAAVVAHIAGEPAAARGWLERAASRHPGIHDDGPLVERVVGRYLLTVPEQARAGVLDSLFADVLSPTKAMGRAHQRLAGDLQAVGTRPAGLLTPHAVTRLVMRAFGRR